MKIPIFLATFLPSGGYGFIFHRRTPWQLGNIKQRMSGGGGVEVGDDRYDVTLKLPLGVTIEKIDGVVAVLGVTEGGNGAAAGVGRGDALVGMQSFFGDAIWAVPTGSEAIDEIEQHIRQCGDEIVLRFQRGGAAALLEGAEEPIELVEKEPTLEDEMATWECVFTPEYYTACDDETNPNAAQEGRNSDSEDGMRDKFEKFSETF